MNDNRTYFDLMKELKSKIRYAKEWHELTEDTKCHLDPDIYTKVIKRLENWKSCFGQMNAAQTHLSKQKVKENDLFLFFGWFKKTILKNDILQFDKSASNLHIIFGYLQIGEILQVNNKTSIPDWMQNHPHAIDENRKKDTTNTIYVARDNLTWNKNKSGAGVFKFKEDLILTKDDLSRSKWNLPDFFKKAKISYHSKNSWKPEGFFKSADIGQEFVIEDNLEVENWAKQIIDNSS